MPKRAPTAAEKRHMDWCASLPCVVSGRRVGVTLHHVTGFADRMGRVPRSHRRVVPLVAELHLIQNGPRESVEALGHRGFYERHGVDLMAAATRLEDMSVMQGRLPDVG